MNINVIVPDSHQVKFQSEGTLSIIGTDWNKVIFMGTRMILHGDEKFHRFAKNLIRFKTLDEKGEVVGDTIIFEYTTDGRLRNSRKLLKSVRHKLMKEILDAAEVAAPDWWPEDANDRSGDALASLNARWYEEYIAPYDYRRQ